MKKIISISLLTLSLFSCNDYSLIEGIESNEKPTKTEEVSNTVKIDEKSYNIVWAEKQNSNSQSCPGNIPYVIMIHFGKNEQGHDQYVYIGNMKSLEFNERVNLLTNTSCTMEIGFLTFNGDNVVSIFGSIAEGMVELKSDKTFKISNVKMLTRNNIGNTITISASGKYTE